MEWTEGGPRLIGANLDSELVSATARHPHRFVHASAIIPPSRGATAFGLKLADGRIADPVQLFTSTSFDLGDFAAHFAVWIGVEDWL